MKLDDLTWEFIHDSLDVIPAPFRVRVTKEKRERAVRQLAAMFREAAAEADAERYGRAS